jgi:antitoxin (DNA-binding transcriptional repressor) of toxin-antitoxin stability system
MTEVGVRALKNRLSEYLRRVKAGERIVVTERGVPIAELSQPAPAAGAESRGMSKLDRLIEEGRVRPALRQGPVAVNWPDIHLPPGTAQQLIDEDRDDSPERY